MSAPSSKHARLLAGAVPIAIALSAAIGTFGARVARADSPNLILNADAETGLCSQSGYEEMTIPGWTVTSGGPNEVCFTNTGGFPPASAPGAQPGNAYFTGGTHGDASMSQTVDVSQAAAAIDAGTATYDLSGWLGGYGSQNDRAGVTATFLSASGVATGTGQLAAVTNTDRGNVTEFLQRTSTGAVPATTRTVRIDVAFTYTAGQTTDGYADDLSLTLNQPISAATLAPSASSVPAYDHVFFVMMENENLSASSNTVDGGAGVIGNSQAPYINALANANALLTNYSAATHNSDPNYVAVAGGGTFGHSAGGGAPTSNCITTCTFNVPSLGDRVDAAGKTWKQYADGASGNCDTSTHGYYYPDDVPFYYFPTMKNSATYCQAHWQPLTQMATDLQSTATTPSFSWFAADDCNDMEACGIASGDAWLSANLPTIFNSPAWTAQRSLLIVTWDEDGNNSPGGFGPGQNNRVATIVAGSQGTVKTGFQSGARYDHYSSARTIEQALGLSPMTANDTYATPMNDVFGSGGGGGTTTTANLVGNPGAEAGASSADGNQVLPIPAWTVTGNMTAVQYGAPGFPSQSSPGSPTRGTAFFAGGPSNSMSSMAQTDDLSAYAAKIDAGSATFDLSGWLGGYATQKDRAQLVVTFLGAQGTSLGSAQIGPVTNTQRSNTTGFLFRSATGAVPAGTRSASLALTATRFNGSYNDGYADDLGLTLSYPT